MYISKSYCLNDGSFYSKTEFSVYESLF